MSISFAKAQAENMTLLDELGSNKSTFETFMAKSILEQYGYEFRDALQKLMNDRGVVSSGALSDNINVEISENGKDLSMQIYVLDYWDYVNKGVKGVKSQSNALNSPYQFKNYGMSVEGRRSISNLINSGRAKVQNVKQQIKGEAKKKSLLEMKTDTLIYLIKKYGIKKTSYFDDAVSLVFTNFAEDMAKAYGEDIKFNLQIKSK